MIPDDKNCRRCRKGYGLVLLTNNQTFARKIIRLFGDVTIQDINNEARAVRRLREAGGHPNLVEIYRDGWLKSHSSPSYFFDMEYCEHTLEYCLNKLADKEDKAIRDGEGQVIAQQRTQTALQIAIDITAGLEFIHSNGQAHRDLKPRNGNSPQTSTRY
jgi:serine/threonine protein kinase